VKIAIVRLSALGDIIQSMIVLQFLREKFPNSTIDWFVDEKFSDIFKDVKYLDSVHILRLSEFKRNKSLLLIFDTIKYLRSFPKYDLVIDLQGLIKSALVSRFIPAKEYIGFNRGSLREPLSAYFYTRSFAIPYHENVVRRYSLLINNALGLNISDRSILKKKPFFDYVPHRKIKNAELKIIIIVGASFASKIYPVESYAKVISSLDADFSIVWNTIKEKNLALRLNKINSRAEIAPKLSLIELKNFLSHADLVIGGDTGPTHMAWALNIPSITIFGSTPMSRNCFITKKNLAVSSDSVKNPYKIDKKDMSIKFIEPEKIISLASKLINKDL